MLPLNRTGDIERPRKEVTVSIKVDGHVDTQKASSFKLALADDRARHEVSWVTAGSTAHPSVLTAIAGYVSSVSSLGCPGQFPFPAIVTV